MAKKTTGKNAGETSVSESDKKGKALELALNKIEKDFGEGAIMKMGEDYRADIGEIGRASCRERV